MAEQLKRKKAPAVKRMADEIIRTYYPDINRWGVQIDWLFRNKPIEEKGVEYLCKINVLSATSLGTFYARMAEAPHTEFGGQHDHPMPRFAIEVDEAKWTRWLGSKTGQRRVSRELDLTISFLAITVSDRTGDLKISIAPPFFRGNPDVYARYGPFDGRAQVMQKAFNDGEQACLRFDDDEEDEESDDPFTRALRNGAFSFSTNARGNA